MKINDRLATLLQSRQMDVAAIQHTLKILIAEDLREGQKLLGGKLKAAIGIREVATGRNGKGADGVAHGKEKPAAPTPANWERVRAFLKEQRGYKASVSAVRVALDMSYSSADAVARSGTHKKLFKLKNGIISLRAAGLKEPKEPKAAKAAKREAKPEKHGRYKPAARKKFGSAAVARWAEKKALGIKGVGLPSREALAEARERLGVQAAVNE